MNLKRLFPLHILVLLCSCNDEEQVTLEQELTRYEWEQMVGIINGYQTGPKQFYRINFKKDFSVEIELDYLGVSGDPDPVTLASIISTYELNVKEKTISFTEPIDTLYVTGGSQIIVYLNKLKIVTLKDGLLETESIDTGLQQGWVLGGGKLFFKKID